MFSFIRWGTYLFEIFKILGLATMALSKISLKNNANSRALFVDSYHGVVYNFVFIFILIVAGCYNMYSNYYRTLTDKSKMNQAIEYFGNFIIYAVSIVLLFKNIVSQKLSVKIGNSLYSIDLVLKKFELKYKERYMALHQVIVILFDLIMWLSVIFVGSFCNVSLTQYLLTYIPNCIINFLILQYVIVLTLILGMSKTINNEFSKYIGTSPSTVLLHKFQRNQLSVQYLSEVEGLIALRESCLNLYDTCDDVSNFYSIPVLSCIIKLFFSIILNTYFFIKTLFLDKSIIRSMDDMWSVTWLSLDAYSLFILTRYITMTINEIKRTGDIIHRVLQHSKNYDVIKQLNNFSSHLLHKNVQFTAMNMFSLDYTLLQSVISSMTTYLVILIQFQQDNT